MSVKHVCQSDIWNHIAFFCLSTEQRIFQISQLGRSLIFSQRSAGRVSPGAVQSIFLRAGLNVGLIDFAQLGNVKNVISNWWTSSDKKVRLSLPAPNRDIGVVLVDVVEDSVLDLGVWIGGHGESVMMVRSTNILDLLLRNVSGSLTIISIVPAQDGVIRGPTCSEDQLLPAEMGREGARGTDRRQQSTQRPGFHPEFRNSSLRF